MTNDQPEPDTGDMPSAKRLREARERRPMLHLHLTTKMKKYAAIVSNVSWKDFEGVTFLEAGVIKEAEGKGHRVTFENDDDTKWKIDWEDSE